MSEQEYDALLFHLKNSNIQTKVQRTKATLQLLPNGKILVDWNDLPKNGRPRRYIIHYKSLNNNQSHAIRVSRTRTNFIIEKFEFGHLYEVHVCSVDRSNKVLASTEPVQIQTNIVNEAPALRVTKSTPDYVLLEWEKPESIAISDIEAYKFIMNGETIAILPPKENRFVVNDGDLGKRYTFQLEMRRKTQRTLMSCPVSVTWPGVTMPKRSAHVNGCDELIISWGDAISINDGTIESFTVRLHDSEGHLLNTIGPNPSECRQVWIKDMSEGIYFHVLEMKLANSKRSIISTPMKIECGRESQLPILTVNYSDADNQQQLVDMAQHIINIRDHMTSKRQYNNCESLLKQILSTLLNIRGSILLNLTIQSKTQSNVPKSYYLIIDGKENSTPIPWLLKDIPLELPRRDQPYTLAVSVTPALYGTKSKPVLVEASEQFSFFCLHFRHDQACRNCSYFETLLGENHLRQSPHEGLVKSPQRMPSIQVYNLQSNNVVCLPTVGETRRFTIILFYLEKCRPSLIQLNYFSNYASTHRAQYNFISINCNQDDIDDLQLLTKDFRDVQCYTDFASEDFEYEEKETETPIHEILSLTGVPSYFVLDYTGRVIWRGRICVPNQVKYDGAIDHIFSRANQLPCSADRCDLCFYENIDETYLESELRNADRIYRSIVHQQLEKHGAKQTKKVDRTRRVFSMKSKPIEVNDAY